MSSMLLYAPRAAYYHGLRVYHQIKVWRNLSNVDLDPLSWGWVIQNQMHAPIMTDIEAGPQDILNIIRCGCKGPCGNKCICRKAGLNCTLSCKECHGVTGTNGNTNIPEVDIEEEERHFLDAFERASWEKFFPNFKNIGEQLTKTSISTFNETVFGKHDQNVKIMPLSNNTVSRRIDEVRKDVEIQLIEKLKTRLFLVQMDESTLRDSKAVLLTYVRYIDNNNFAEEMLFCKSLKSSTTAKDIYSTLKSYLDTNKIPMKNITSCAADGAPNIMGKKNGCLKLMKDENPDMFLVHCVIYGENLVAKNTFHVLNKIMNLVVKCINSIKASAKHERIFKLFCKENNEAHVRLLLHTEVKWLSKGNCLKRFMVLFDTLKLQGTNKTLVNGKAKIFGFITSIELFEKDVYQKQFEKFHWLQKYKVTNTAILNIVEHLKNLSADLKGRFSDLKEIDLPTWLMQPMLVNLSHISNMQYQEELTEMQNDESVKTLFNIKGSMA
ncbi:zinc finger BED domain-containing protein 5-like [Hydra vulgaris]|uniref:Zinc finger BED domain-containing protein 5-like n=1 Tax=Hydra vulgaris TaxID=6087 RepID=A0ABM4CLE9_HYDVU